MPKKKKIGQNRQSPGVRRRIRNSTPQSRMNAVNKTSIPRRIVQAIASGSPQAQGINLAERKLRGVNQANKKKKKR